jgi:hypothetical protein
MVEEGPNSEKSACAMKHGRRCLHMAVFIVEESLDGIGSPSPCCALSDESSEHSAEEILMNVIQAVRSKLSVQPCSNRWEYVEHLDTLVQSLSHRRIHLDNVTRRQDHNV